MITKLPNKINNLQEAEDFLYQLFKNGELYHLDDLNDDWEDIMGYDGNDMFENRGEFLLYEVLLKESYSFIEYDSYNLHNTLIDPTKFSKEFNYLRDELYNFIKILIRNSKEISSDYSYPCINISYDNYTEIIFLNGKLQVVNERGLSNIEVIPLDDLIVEIENAR